MKTVIKMMSVLLLSVVLGSCKTQERVTSGTSTSSHVSVSSEVKSEEEICDNSERRDTSWRDASHISDSVVCKYYERIVTDSSGNVLWHELEQSKEAYRGHRQSTSISGSMERDVSSQETSAKSAASTDSLYSGGVLEEVTVVKSVSWDWLWYVLLPSLLVAVAGIIYKCKV